MIVTCPKCEARYAVDPLAIGPSGRTVQCARCDSRWFQRVEGPPTPPDLLIRPPSREASSHDPSSLPVPIAARPDAGSGHRVLLTVFVVLVALGGIGYAAYSHRDRLPMSAGAVADKLIVYRDRLAVYRDRLIAMLPKQLPFFSSDKEAPVPAPSAAASSPPSRAAAPAPPSSSTGAPPAAATPATPAPRLDPPATAAQLEVDLTASKIELVDGRYVMRGEIVNHGGLAGSPIRLTVQFKKGNEVLISRSYPLAIGAIPGGDRLSFSQVLDNPPPGATDIVPSVE